jgi:hypothetical protein
MIFQYNLKRIKKINFSLDIINLEDKKNIFFEKKVRKKYFFTFQ